MITPFPKLSILLFIGVFLLLPYHALADITQSDSATASDASTGAGASTIIQYLGTGLTGTFGSGDFYVERTGGGGTMVLSTYIWVCTTADSGGRAAEFETGGSPTDCTQTAFWEYFPVPGSKTLATDAALNTTVIADEDNYYYLQFQDNGGDPSTFIIYGSASNTWPAGSCITTACGAVEDVYFSISGISGGGIPDTTTRVVDVFPPDDPTFASPYATSTAFDIEGDIYVNAADFIDNMVFRQRIFNNSAAASLAAGPSFSEGGNLLCNALPSWLCPRPAEYIESVPTSITIEYDIVASGDSSYATTTSILALGNYTMVSEIIRPNSSFFGLIPGADSIFVSTTTRFQVVEPSGYDIIIGDTIQAIQDLKDGIAPTCSFDFTAPGDFLPSLTACIVAIYQVAAAEVLLALQNAVSNFLSHAPWGYGMLVYQALQEDSTATTTLPSMAFDFSVVPSVAPVSIDLTPWEHMMCPGSQFASFETPDGDNFLNDILLHWWNILCWVIWAIAVLVFVFKIDHDQDYDGDD